MPTEGQGKGPLTKLHESFQGEHLLVLGHLGSGQKLNSPSLDGGREGSVLARKGCARLFKGRQAGPCFALKALLSGLTIAVSSYQVLLAFWADHWHATIGSYSPSTTS